MDNAQLKQIATGAITGHWPTHLGLHTDAEKIEWLAREVERLAGIEAEHDEAEEAAGKLEDIIDCPRCELCKDHE